MPLSSKQKLGQNDDSQLPYPESPSLTHFYHIYSQLMTMDDDSQLGSNESLQVLGFAASHCFASSGPSTSIQTSVPRRELRGD